MGCKCAKRTAEWHGYECEVTGGECMFIIPNSKRCAELYGEGPDIKSENQTEDENPTRIFTKCKSCNKPFSISEEEQKWLKDKGLKLFTHCKDCRKARKDDKQNGNKISNR